jgi:hypothetical protein
LSTHNNALKTLMDFKNEKTSIIAILKKTTQYESDYETRLFAHIEVVRYLLFQGLEFAVMMNLKDP